MRKNSFIARIPEDLGMFFQYIGEEKKWSFATVLRELVKTSPFYFEFLKKNGGS